MLDAGVISSEQLSNIFSAKGYAFEVTDYKRVPGAKKGTTIDTWTINEDGSKSKKSSEYIEETEEIIVPIINGTSNIGHTLGILISEISKLNSKLFFLQY